jgi:hypothetical protein
VALIARAEKYGKGVTRHRVAADGALTAVIRPGQMAIDANHLGLAMKPVGLILNLILVAGGAEGVGGYSFAGALGVDFVAINAGDLHLTVPA